MYIDVEVKQYYETALCTTWMTEIEEDSDDKAQDDDLQLNPEEILK